MAGLVCVGALASPAAAAPPAGQAAGAWRPKLLFGTVNFNDQLAKHPDQWRQAAARMDGMLLHVHFFVRGMSAPGKAKIEGAEETIRGLAPLLKGKANVIELTYHLTGPDSSPERIARDHGAQVARMEKEFGIPVTGVNVDWILSQIAVQEAETPRNDSESDINYGRRVTKGLLAKSERYVKAFRQAGRDEPLYAVFPPAYMGEGDWAGVGKNPRPGVTLGGVLGGLFAVGYDGFVADSPLGLLRHPTYKQKGYWHALQAVQAVCRRDGKQFGFIVNNNNDKDGPAYDAQFQADVLEVADVLQEAGLRPDTLIVESWYKGPFRLAPDTEAGTLTNTFLRLADKVQAAPRGGSKSK